MSKLRQRAREAAHNAIARTYGRAGAIMGPEAILADAIERECRAFAERACVELWRDFEYAESGKPNDRATIREYYGTTIAAAIDAAANEGEG